MQNLEPLMQVGKEPNFILVGDHKRFFGDIIPVYKNHQELTSFIVSSKDSLARLVYYSRVFFVCLFSLLLETLHNAVYQSFLALSYLYESTINIPSHAVHLKNSLLETVTVFRSSHTRELWWLGLKLESSKLVSKIKSFIDSLILILSKFYLLGLIVLVFGLLSFGQTYSTQQQAQTPSFLGRVVENHTQKIPPTALGVVDTTNITALSTVQQGFENKDQFLLDNAIKHDVREGETVEIISEMYGLTIDTITFNNQISVSDPLPETILLPWTDGYIYRVENDITPEELERIYGIDKNLIYSENEDLLNRENGKFPKDSFLLLPTTNYGSIETANVQESQRIENLRKAEEQRKVREEALARGRKQTFSNDFSQSVNVQGFIWPTTGNISRCVVGSHIACDIANPSLPPIFSVQSGSVSAVYRYSVPGYGLAVVVDHGGGVQTLYAHMSEVYVSPGQLVIQGQSLGRMGCTGLCFGSHLHFEVRVNGIKQNPLNFLP